MIVMPADKNRFGGLRVGSLPSSRPANVITGGFRLVERLRKCIVPACRARARLRPQIAIDADCNAVGSHRHLQAAVGNRVGNNRRRRVKLILGHRLSRNRNRASDRATDARDAFLIRRMLAIWLGHDQHANRAVRLGIHHLDTRRRIACIAGSIEDRSWVVFLRLVIENQNDLAVHIDAAVIVVIQLGRGDAEASKDDAAVMSISARKRPVGLRKLPLLLALSRFSAM